MQLCVNFSPNVFFPPNRMKLLGRTPQVWKKDGLNSCSYKTLSIERMPLYVNVTVDIGKP